jgi:formamidopyrimidine-DNA glycosylase
MPELPEVETTRRGLAPQLEGQRLTGVKVRERRLRMPVPRDLASSLTGARMLRLERRAKFLLLRFEHGTLLLHLGMSGSLRLTSKSETLRKHDHMVFQLAKGRELRFHDPRRFGLCVWIRGDPLAHPLLRDLGPEPLEPGFDAAYLKGRLRGRKAAVKTLLLDSRVLAGVGNIYASEALFLAGVRPTKPGGKLSLSECELLVTGVRTILTQAIEAGGTSLRDYVNSAGDPGSFKLDLNVYARTGQACPRCRSKIRERRMGQRSTFWCGECQT